MPLQEDSLAAGLGIGAEAAGDKQAPKRKLEFESLTPGKADEFGSLPDIDSNVAPSVPSGYPATESSMPPSAAAQMCADLAEKKNLLAIEKARAAEVKKRLSAAKEKAENAESRCKALKSQLIEAQKQLKKRKAPPIEAGTKDPEQSPCPTRNQS